MAEGEDKKDVSRQCLLRFTRSSCFLLSIVGIKGFGRSSVTRFHLSTTSSSIEASSVRVVKGVRRGSEGFLSSISVLVLFRLPVSWVPLGSISSFRVRVHRTVAELSITTSFCITILFYIFPPLTYIRSAFGSPV